MPDQLRSSQKASFPSPQNPSQLALWLFILSLTVYLLTRFIHLPRFPIYFFTDEAIQTQHAADLVARGFRDAEGILFPTYFQNGGQYNLSLSVYVQVLPYLIFGKSIWVTRGTSVLLSLIAAIASGLILKQAFKSRGWWLGPLLLAAAPAWFLHSRTAFETVLMASLYAGFLYFYLRYRDNRPQALYPALLFGALAFYAYSPGQVIVVVTGSLLLIADWRYHWLHRKSTLIGLGLLVFLTLPYFRFVLANRHEPLHHLTLLNSYWVKPLPFREKVLTYALNFLKGFNPLYWYLPNPSIINRLWPEITLPGWLFSNQADLARHTMKSWGHLLWITFPFWVIGLVKCIRQFNEPACRTMILATLAAPTGAAVVDWGITRGLVFIIPATMITALGLESCLIWVERKYPKIQTSYLFAVIFLILSTLSFWILGDALHSGPTWYTDYGLGGMQYGGQQVFSRANEIALTQPETTVFVSSTWANGPDVVMRFFAGDLGNLRLGNINVWGLEVRPLDRSMLFTMTQEDLDYIRDSGKFDNITITEVIPYPDGSEGFFFVHLDYVDDIEAILAAEREARQALQTEFVTINYQKVRVSYPTLDMNEIIHAFDGDLATVTRTLEANPMRLVLSFPEPIKINQVTLWIGGTPTRMTVMAIHDEETLSIISEEAERAPAIRAIPLTFKQTLLIDTLEIEILNTHDGEIAHVHLWEVSLE